MYDLALTLIKRAEKEDESSAWSDYRRVSEILYQIAQGEPDESAIQYLKSALDYAPEHRGALELLEQLAKKSGQEGILPFYWVRHVASAPEGPQADRLRLRLAGAYADAGQFEDAVFCLEPIAQRGNLQAKALLRELHQKLGHAPSWEDMGAVAKVAAELEAELESPDKLEHKEYKVRRLAEPISKPLAARPGKRGSISFEALRSIEMFSALPDPAIEEMTKNSITIGLEPGERLTRGSRLAGERYFFVISGLVCMALEYRYPGQEEAGADPYVGEYIGYFTVGDCFSDAYLDERAQTPVSQIDCIAQTATLLLSVTKSYLLQLLRTDPDWARKQERRNARLRFHFQRQRLPARRLIQDFFFRQGYALASTMRVMQLDRCIDCDSCSKACVKRHGIACFERNAPRLGRLAFPLTCRSCVDHRCVDACGFGALSYDATLGEAIIGKQCAGCGGCARACPNRAISLMEVVYTVDDFPIPVPESGAGGETNIPGLYVAGDVAGEALIKTCINAGKRAVDHIAAHGKPRSDARALDVTIVGAGPAGLSAALACQDHGLSYCVFEKDRVAAIIHSYPKNKHVLAEPAHLPLEGRLWFQDSTREKLIAKWEETVRSEALSIQEGVEVTRVAKSEIGAFVVETSRGVYSANHVIIAAGIRSSPRKLEVQGDSPERVRYALDNPREFAGKHALVVGGGDSAVETALSLAELPDTAVTLSYRKGVFSRVKALNRRLLDEAAAEGRIRIELKSTVAAIGNDNVTLKFEGGQRVVKNDVIFAMLGADPPTAFLKRCGIKVLEPGSEAMAAYAASRGMRWVARKCSHCAGYPDQACVSACPTGALIEIKPADIFIRQNKRSGLAREDFSGVPFLEGVEEHLSRKRGAGWVPWVGWLVAMIVIGVGIECFLRKTLPERSLSYLWLLLSGSTQEIVFESGKGLGHWLGYLGASLMLLCCLYPLRSRLGWFKRAIARATWMSVHLMLGFSGAAFTTYHSMFKLDRWTGLACIAMWLVVASGIVGRYLYGRVYSDLGLAEFERQSLQRKRRQLVTQWGREYAGAWFDDEPFPDVLATNEQRSGVLSMLWQDARDWMRLLKIRYFGLREIRNSEARKRTAGLLADWIRNRRSLRHLERAKKLLSYWNKLHLALTIIMFVLSIIHIVNALIYKAV